MDPFKWLAHKKFKKKFFEDHLTAQSSFFELYVGSALY